MALPTDITISPLTIITHGTVGPVTPTSSVRALRTIAGYIPSRQASSFAQDAINLAGDYLTGGSSLREEARLIKWRHAQIKLFTIAMDEARSLDSYEQCTTRLDILQGHEYWKNEFGSIEPEYNPVVIQKSMEQLRTAANLCDIGQMNHLIRTSLSRDLGGMNLLRLYKHSWFGTKKVINDYIEAAVGCIDKFLGVTEQCRVTTTESRYYQNSMEDALKFFGRSALTLSGGANLGMKHVGVVKALWENELLPDIISGASAGSIVAAIVGSHSDLQMNDVLTNFPYGNLTVFADADLHNIRWALDRVAEYIRHGVIFQIENLKRIMRQWLGDITFKEAHNKTGRIVNICVSSAEVSEPRLLNYITAPDVYIWSAVCASCSVPGIFPSATIYQKDSKTGEPAVWMLHSQQWVDGSLDSDIPMRKLSEMFNVNFFIVSQVNPHVRMFIQNEEQFAGIQPTTPSAKKPVVRTLINLGRAELVHRAQMINDIGLANPLTRTASLLTQQYTGDINIFPEIGPQEYIYMLSNPTPEYMLHAMDMGEKATWPKMCRIKNSVAIEMALIRAIRVFRDRVNFGPEAAKARQESQESIRRGRVRHGRARRPSFLRRRSLSNEASIQIRDIYGRNGPPSPGLNEVLRRNNSAGSLVERVRLSLTRASTSSSNVLAPQAGVEEPDAAQRSTFNLDHIAPFEYRDDLGEESDHLGIGDDIVPAASTSVQSPAVAHRPFLSLPPSPIATFKTFMGGRFG